MVLGSNTAAVAVARVRTIIIRQNTAIAFIGLRSGLEKSLVGQTDRK